MRVDVGAAHLAAALVALPCGLAVLVRRKGGARHVLLGRAYVALMAVVALPVLFLYDISGRPGPFHVLAVISTLTTGLGWLLGHRAGGHRHVGAHATLMTWSWIGLVTAGVAQLANQRWPDASPWPVLLVVGVSTLVGLVAVPRWVARELRTRERVAAGRATVGR